jgi:hypothetical protein
MPISYNYKVIFVHIPKCAGTSLEKMFDMSSEDQFFSTSRVRDTSINVPREKFTDNEYQSCVSRPPQHMTYEQLKKVAEIDETFTKFSIIRNPYSRFVSEFEYRKKFDPKIVNLSDLADCLDLPEIERIDRFHGHLETQTSYLKDGKHFFNGVLIRLEEFEERIEYIRRLAPIKTIPHSLKSDYSKPYKEYYTPEVANKVLNFYKNDFELFNYSKDL